MSLSITIEQAMELHERTCDHIVNLQLNRIALGIDLINNEESRAWEKLGFDNFPAYCAAPPDSNGLGLSNRSRQTTMQVARRYVNDLGVRRERLSPIPYSNLAVLVPVVTEENLEEVLTDALVLGNRDVKRNLKDGKYNGEDIEIKPEPEPPKMKRKIRCPHCNEWIALILTNYKEGTTLDLEE